MKLVLPYPPSVNAYWTPRRGGGVMLTPEARRYKQGAKLRALAEGLGKPLACPVVLTATVYRPQRRGDLDNTLKGLLDALNGIAWVDDSQVVEIHARREDDRLNPRVEVSVEAA